VRFAPTARLRPALLTGRRTPSGAGSAYVGGVTELPGDVCRCTGEGVGQGGEQHRAGPVCNKNRVPVGDCHDGLWGQMAVWPPNLPAWPGCPRRPCAVPPGGRGLPRSVGERAVGLTGSPPGPGSVCWARMVVMPQRTRPCTCKWLGRVLDRGPGLMGAARRWYTRSCSITGQRASSSAGFAEPGLLITAVPIVRLGAIAGPAPWSQGCGTTDRQLQHAMPSTKDGHSAMAACTGGDDMGKRSVALWTQHSRG
jgi:hypothetical protein